jgi:hypothetical protein
MAVIFFLIFIFLFLANKYNITSFYSTFENLFRRIVIFNCSMIQKLKSGFL